MSNTKPSLPKGTRDFGPVEMARRNYILETIKDTFRLFGFEQLETPAMENLSTLTGKYGDEGDQLLFKILNSGDYLKGVTIEEVAQGSSAILPKIAEKGLRYDLTVPFARFVVMNRNELVFPFKRFQIQPVWRADRPQRGRYREFYQCDADVVGTDSLVCEAEILLMIKRVFGAFGLTDYTIKINNRKILTGLAEFIGAPGKEQELCVSIDKLDKIGWEKVKGELLDRGFVADAIDKLAPIVRREEGLNADTLGFFREILGSSIVGSMGVDELSQVLDLLEAMGGDQSHVSFDPMLARGLSYYTGAIFEVKINNVSIGSVSGGGRYDNLTGVFGLPDVSGVGFSFGVDRIYDVLLELGLFGDVAAAPVDVLITHFGQQEMNYGLGILSELRALGISAEIYPDTSKIKKQFAYADKKNIPYVIVIGSEEMNSAKVTLKNLRSGEQHTDNLNKVCEVLVQKKRSPND
ncbi:Histidyl-tRNA synthetase [Lunatimonas lonarensis]|uniref:Histidine--tRNA ligase n=1 Tax=Lunatimonas lonarensis TaxID=1232681 RepID=R7ZX18_9BACT|nr:histidine--tRNA ligase [Lunatimonas lonarensis]EON78558.1 Histidyl-tRNA synthetase [Lunatimonas lonarensis]